MKKLLIALIAIGIPLIFIDMKIFLIYFLAVYVIDIHVRTDFLRKIIRVFSVREEIRSIAIVRKLGISDEDLKEVENEMKKKIGDEEWCNLAKEVSDLIA